MVLGGVESRVYQKLAWEKSDDKRGEGREISEKKPERKSISDLFNVNVQRALQTVLEGKSGS